MGWADGAISGAGGFGACTGGGGGILADQAGESGEDLIDGGGDVLAAALEPEAEGDGEDGEERGGEDLGRGAGGGAIAPAAGEGAGDAVL